MLCVTCTTFSALDNFYPVDTGRKLNVHKTFRWRPRRHLNVLCTFNLRPVSTEYVYIVCIKEEKSEWLKYLSLIISPLKILVIAIIITATTTTTIINNDNKCIENFLPSAYFVRFKFTSNTFVRFKK